MWPFKKKVFEDRCNSCGNVFLDWSVRVCGLKLNHTIVCHQYHYPPKCTECCVCNCFMY